MQAEATAAAAATLGPKAASFGLLGAGAIKAVRREGVHLSTGTEDGMNWQLMYGCCDAPSLICSINSCSSVWACGKVASDGGRYHILLGFRFCIWAGLRWLTLVANGGWWHTGLKGAAAAISADLGSPL